MEYRIKISKQVLSDFDHAFKWYKAKEPELGQRFEKEFKTRIDQIKKHPEMFQEIQTNQRRAVIGASFPYSIHYLVDKMSKTIEIAGVFHHNKQPEKALEQTKLEQLQKIRDQKEQTLKRLNGLERIRKSKGQSKDQGLER